MSSALLIADPFTIALQFARSWPAGKRRYKARQTAPDGPIPRTQVDGELGAAGIGIRALSMFGPGLMARQSNMLSEAPIPLSTLSVMVTTEALYLSRKCAHGFGGRRHPAPPKTLLAISQ
jgi:hypothetical protein